MPAFHRCVAASLLAWGGALAPSAAPASEAPDPAIAAFADRLAGTWNEVLLAAASCTDTTYLHTFTLSPDGLRLTLRYRQPFQGVTAMVSEKRYRVLYAQGNALMLYQEGETFEDRETGDRLVRQLILDKPDTYAWRVYGRPRDFRAAGGGLRCAP